MNSTKEIKTVKDMQELLAEHGYNYGEDAAESALVGYELAMIEMGKL